MTQPVNLQALLGPVSVPADEVRDWIFTFGFGHRGVAVSSARVDPTEPQPKGFRLDDRFVRITGTYIEARERMIATFGAVWSMQYMDERRAGVAQFGLTELVLTDDYECSAIDDEERQLLDIEARYEAGRDD